MATWLLVAGLAAIVGYLGWGSLGWPLIHDAPIMHYIAWRIGEGAVPYRDLFDMNFPGVYLVHLALLRTLGAGDAAWRIFDLAWLALTGVLVARLAAPWGGLAAAGGALFFAAYHLGGGAWQVGQRDFLLCACLLAAALGVVGWGERRRWAALVLGGLALGAGATIKPHVAVFGLGLVLLVLVAPGRPPGERWTAAVVFAGSMSLVPLGVVAWLAVIGALDPWRRIVADYLMPLYSRLGRPAVWTVYRSSLWPPIAVALLLSLGHALATSRFTFRHAVAVAGLAYGLLHYVGQGKGWEYHLYPLAAFAAPLLFSELGALRGAWRITAGVPLLASLAMVVVVLGSTGATEVDAAWIADKARAVGVLTADLRQRTRPDDTVQVLDTTDGGVHALLRARLREPTRFLYDFHFFHDVERPAIRALRAELVGGLEARPPRYVVLFRNGWPAGGYERLDGFPELARLLDRRYRVDVQRPTYTIYAKRNGS